MGPWEPQRWITTDDLGRSRTCDDLDGLRAAATSVKGQIRQFLDIGCGYGGLSALVGEYLAAEKVHGVDIDERVIDTANAKGVAAQRVDVEVEKLPFGDGELDCVMTLGMMDYLVYFDGMIREINRVLANKGYVMVALPNLASWHTRLLLLGGYQPRDVEISNEILAGVPRRPWRNRGEGPAGHIHIPTVRAFTELMEHHGFRTVKVSPGRPSMYSKHRLVDTIDKFASRRATLARRFYYVGQKERSPEPPTISANMPYQCL